MPSPHGHIAIVCHDTISSPKSSFKAVVRYCCNKWSKPAYNEIIGRNGEHEVLTWKTSYNAGKINERQYKRLQRSHTTMAVPPKDSTITRNSTLWGIAFDRAAREPISSKQWEKMVSVLAWRCKEWNLDPKRHIVGHKTLTRRKSDPWNYGSVKVLEKLRKDVAKRMGNKPSSKKVTTKTCKTCGQTIKG